MALSRDNDTLPTPDPPQTSTETPIKPLTESERQKLYAKLIATSTLQALWAAMTIRNRGTITPKQALALADIAARVARNLNLPSSAHEHVSFCAAVGRDIEITAKAMNVPGKVVERLLGVFVVRMEGRLDGWVKGDERRRERGMSFEEV